MTDLTNVSILNIADFIFKGDLLTDNERNQFKSLLTRKYFKKGNLLTEPGEIAKKFYLVKDGVIRNFLICQDHKEHTKVFHGPGGLLGSYSEFLAGRETLYYIEAVTNTTVDVFSIVDFLKLVDQTPTWIKIQQALAEASFLDKEEREIMLLTMNVKQRYAAFQKRFSAFADKIPKYMIASYIGSTPEGLSKALKSKV